MDIEIVEVPICTGALFFKGVVYCPPSARSLLDAICHERSQLRGLILSPRKNVVAFLRQNEVIAGRSREPEPDELLFYIPQQLRTYLESIFIEIAEESTINADAHGDEHELIGSARILCDVLGRPLAPAILPFNTRGGRTAIFQIPVGMPFIVLQALLFRSGESMALVETFVSTFTRSLAFLSVSMRRSEFVYDQLSATNLHLQQAFVAGLKRCCVPMPKKPAFANC